MSSVPHPGSPGLGSPGPSSPYLGQPDLGQPAGAEVPAVLAGLIDDAALFPPASTPMAEAVLAHRRHRTAPYAALVGRLLCPVGRVGEVRAALDAEPACGGLPPFGTGPLRVGVIGDAAVDRLPRALADVAADPRLVLEAVEIPLPARISGRRQVAEATKHAVAALPAGLRGYVEVPRVPGWEAALDVLCVFGRSAKLRTGGTGPDAVPSVAELARFLTACAARLLPLKCTAGLHHAVRRQDPATGTDQHGFLNVLVGAAAAVTRADPSGPLSDPDGARLAEQALALDPGPVRALFTGLGSCSIAEPVADLRALGLLP
jgi:hypothetical protein